MTNDNEEIFEMEKFYLKKVVDFLQEQIDQEVQSVEIQKGELKDIRKEMFAQGVPSADDYEGMAELNQYRSMEMMQSSQYTQRLEKINKYKKVIHSPYFGRFDFTEEGEGLEKVYIGYQNVMNDDTYEMLVYDWRTPIASIYYRNELGKAKYTAPCGDIYGTVSLKRQYEIEDSKLKYYFDCAVTITDELLKEALGGHASSYMKNIVETIQKEQDEAIRDCSNDLLIVQGVAGSGKTSVAMHRIAFLLYEGMSKDLTNNNIMILSPNKLFGEYISKILPELGEDNVANITMEEIFKKYFKGRPHLRSRHSQLEYMITNKHRNKIRQSIAFKGSMEFTVILERYLDYLEKDGIEFKDIYYAGQIVRSGNFLKERFRDNAIGMSIEKRLKRIESSVQEQILELEKKKRPELMKEIVDSGDFAFEEEEECARRLGIYKGQALNVLYSFTKINVAKWYKELFKDKKLFYKLAKGLELPSGIENILYQTIKNFKDEVVNYEDGMAMLYLKLCLEDKTIYPNIKQLLIDEAQDYYPIHYKILAILFKGASFTVLGDIGQTIEKKSELNMYDEIVKIMKPKSSLRLTLNKSYRSSYEITQFNRRLRTTQKDATAFERHGEMPIISQEENVAQMQDWIIDKVKEYEAQGYETIAILCKSKREVNAAYSKLSKKINLQTVEEYDTEIGKGVFVMPIYMAKGLEYDAVIVYEVNKQNYHEEEDRQLLYIACTRALHKLALCYTDELSPFLSE